MDAGGDRIYSTQLAVIREVYDSEFAHDRFAQELEKALEAHCNIIVIEPNPLGDETARWITVGNCLHKTAVVSGLASIVTGFVWPDCVYTYLPFTVFSAVCTSLYTISWQFDNCVKYQVERDRQNLSKLQVNALYVGSPTVLVRKDDTRRKILHCSITLAATVICIVRLYRMF
ncbi:transmembrane protein 11-A, mitochondrial [Onthophagus taurus]|uniref:transmembrane protein 11-A, mitochondrial n=1 Tax=Onthophagus taurus TaxID=166361 RepID=UPI000C20F728|nr:transmembrane protein 11-A, mitochondrial [Onthophagus taurus]